MLIYYDSLLEAIGIDPARDRPDRPRAVTIKRAQELSGLSRSTINRMIKLGDTEKLK